MINVKKLTKSYDSNLVLDDISLSVASGKLTTLLGQNGCGKSTLLRMMSGFELPDSGSVEYNNENLGSISFSKTHDICFVHEKLEYLFPLTMDKYLEMMTEEIPNWDQKIFDKMLAARRIDIKKNFIDYSRGQKMQVALMIAIASNAQVLLLDEITSVIDVYGRKYFLEILSDYVKSGKTVVITTNIINELEFYTDRLVIIKDQKIRLDENVEDIPGKFIKIRKKGELYHEVFEDPKCIWAGVNSDRSISFVIPSEVIKNYSIPDDLYDKRKSSLEDIFIYYFTQSEYENLA